MKRAIAAVLLSAGLALVPVAPALAGTNGGHARAPGPSMPAGGGGQVYVDGAGSVRVLGNFLAFGDVGGMDVRVTDRHGDARVIVDGRTVLAPLRTTRGAVQRSVRVRPGPRQRVTVEGRRAEATFRGDGNLSLSITGDGSVRLDGVGMYRVNNRAERSWPLRPITIPLRPTPPGGRG